MPARGADLDSYDHSDKYPLINTDKTAKNKNIHLNLAAIIFTSVVMNFAKDLIIQKMTKFA